MRLSRLEPRDLKPLIDRAEPLIARVQPIAARARDGLAQLDPYVERMRPYVDRIGAEVRKRPKLAAGVGTIATTWQRLVDAFCDVIDPYLSRYFPDVRLIAITTGSDELVLHRVVKGEATEVGALTALDATLRTELEAVRWSAIELRLRPEQVLRRTLSLPGASRDFLAAIIDHRLERLTPWKPDKVLYGYRVLEAEEEAGSLQIALLATSRDIVAGPLRALGDAGLVPTAIGAEDEAFGEPLRVSLVAGGKASAGTATGGRVESRRLVSRVALLVFAVLALGTLVAATMASRATADQVATAAKLSKARRLLRNAALGNLGSRERSLIEAKQPGKSMVVLIDKLAAAIPADTYLKELAVTPDKVRLVGTSGNAPALVKEIESTGLINVRFTAAVTRERDQRDSFEITADRKTPAVGSR